MRIFKKYFKNVEVSLKYDKNNGVLYFTVRHGTVRYGTVLYGTVRYGTVRYGTVLYVKTNVYL